MTARSCPKTVAKNQLQRREQMVLEVGMSTVPKSIDPQEVWNFQHFLVLQSVYQTLVRMSEKGRIVSDLARTWEVKDEGKRYIFNLDTEATFHDGRRVTSKDVAYSLSRHFWPESKSVVRSYLENILPGVKGLKKGQIPACFRMTESHKLEITLERAYAPLLSVLAMPGYSVVPEINGPPKSWVGSGPMVAEWDQAENYWRLCAYDRYTGPLPKIKQINVRRIDSVAQVQSLVAAKALDMVLGFSSPQITQNSLPKGYQLMRTNSLAFMHFFFNNSRPLFANAEMRKDLAALILEQAQKPEHVGDLLSFEPHYLPRGILPANYYDRELPKATLEEVKTKWQKQIKNKKLTMVMRHECLLNSRKTADA